jgi:cobalt-zinc-cadmium efflux system outer membrane protein
MNKQTSESQLMLTPLRSQVLIILLCCFAQSTALAQDPMTLSRALNQTLASNPALQLYPYTVRMSEAAQMQASLSPNPTLNVEVENAFGTGDLNGLSHSEATLTLGQTIELGDKRLSRMNYATASTQNMQAEYELKRLTVLAETSRRYYDILRLQAIETVYLNRVEQEKKALSVIKKRANAGAAGKADVSKMALRLARSKAQYQRLTSALNVAKTRLSAMWLAEPDFKSVTGDIKQSPNLPDVITLNEAIEKTPTFLLQQAQQELMRSQLQLTRANGYSNARVGVGIRYLAESDDQALVFDFSVPLTLENPNKGKISAANAAFEKSRQQTDLKRAELKLTLIEIQHSLIADADYAAILNQQLLPQAHQLLSDTIKGYQHGRYSVLQWVDAQKEQFELDHELIEIHHQIYLNLLDLERLTGQPLTTTNKNSIGNVSYE